MNWLSNLFLCATVSFLFGLLIFIIMVTLQNSVIFAKLIKKSWSKIIVHIVCGVLMSTPCILIYYLCQSSDQINVFSSIYVLIIIFPTVMYMSPFFGLGAMLMNVVFLFVVFKKHTYIDIYNSVCFAVYVIITFIIYYVFRKTSGNLKTLCAEMAFIVLQIVGMLLIIYAYKKEFYEYRVYLWANFIGLHIFYLMTFLICIYLNLIYLKTRRMQIAANYQYDNFVDKHNAVRIIDEYIKANNVQYAFVVAFHIAQNTSVLKNIGSRVISQINISIAQAIYKNFTPQKPVFFINNHDVICMFIKIDSKVANKTALMYKNNNSLKRNEDDPLSILNFPAEHDFRIAQKNLVIKSKISVMTSIYGIQTSYVEEAIGNVNKMVINDHTGNNQTNVRLYDSRTYATHENDMTKFIKLRNLININEIKIKFERMNYNDDNIYVPLFAYFEKLLFGAKQILSIVDQELQIVFMRHLAASAMQSFAYEPDNAVKRLLIKYPIETISSEHFSSNSFINKLFFYQLMNNNVILLLNMDYLPNDCSYLMTNIRSLYEHGIQIVCTNVTAKQLLLVQKMQPLFILFKEYCAINKDATLKYKTAMKNALHKLKLQYYNR